MQNNSAFNFSEIFIKRPVATSLLMISLLVFGLFAYRLLPVSELPDVEFPTIVVNASLPGASPQTMASAVATPLEQQFSTIAGLSMMSSVSSLGTTQITLQFSLDRSIDSAALDVQSAISAAGGQLPSGMPNPPTFNKVNPASAPIIYLALSSDTVPLSKVNLYGETILGQQISMVSGVAQVSILGSQKYAVRIQVNPNKLFYNKLGLTDVVAAIQANNVELPTGYMNGSKQAYFINVDGQLTNAEAYKPLPITYINGAPLRLQDIGTALDSVQNQYVASWVDGKRGIVLAVQRQPGTNTIEVINGIKKILPRFMQSLPADIKLSTIYDRSETIRASIFDVQLTLIIAAILVVAIIFLFLRNLTATLIPAIALPLSIIGSFAFMHLFGFNLDNLSLLALTLSVGYVVDDAIVMLENIFRHREMGEDSLTAALNGSREISFTIISMTLSLVAVFIPVMFMSGLLGRLFHEFGVTISIAILTSGFISLSLTPMLASRYIKNDIKAHQSKWLDKVESVYQRALHGYERTLQWVFAHQFLMLLVFFATLFLSLFLFYVIPKGFLPSEDTSQIFAYTEADPAISFNTMVERQQQIANIIHADPNVANMISSVGAGGASSSANAGRIFMHLTPRSSRALSADEIIQEMRQKIANVPGITAYLQNVPSIRIGNLSKSSYQFTLQSIDTKALYEWADKLTNEMKLVRGFQDVTNDLVYTGPQLDIQLMRDKMAALGINAKQVEDTLAYAYGGQGRISTIYKPEASYWVLMELEPAFQDNPDLLAQLYVRANSGQVVPLSALTSTGFTPGLLTINHIGQLPAVTISFNLAPNVALSEAVDTINQLKSQLNIPISIVTSFQGTAQAFQSSSAGLTALLLIAILTVYIVLGILYESFIHPLTILSGLPSAAVGALLTLMICRVDLNLYSFIGVIMLVGIVKKNAIMMVDFAISARRLENKSPSDAIYSACLIRFRPIMMTTMAALMGVMPIVLAFGEGSESRRPLGIAVMGGLLVSQLLTLYITPVIYLYLEKLSQSSLFTKRLNSSKEIAGE